jgi:hypothetical protein
MRRTRFQQGSLTTRKRKGRIYWLAQWREEGGHRTKELGLCSKSSSHAAKIMLQEILKPINARAERKEIRTATFEQFVENVYIPVFQGGKWKDSTADNEIPQIRYHLVRAFGEEILRNITDEALQAFLNETAKSCGQSVLDHLRFRLRSIFKLAMAKGIVDRNPVDVLFTPRDCKPGREKRVLKPSDLFVMLEVLNVRERLIARLATWEGMRPGEILALRVADVDLTEDCVWIRRRLYKGKLGDPKSDRSKRQAALTLARRNCSARGSSGAVTQGMTRGFFPPKTASHFGAITSGGVTCCRNWSRPDCNGQRFKSCGERGRAGRKRWV